MQFSVPDRSQRRAYATAALQADAAALKADTVAPRVRASVQRSMARLRPSRVPARSPQEVLRGTGRPLAAPLREEMEGRFGANFSAVRVHADSAARASAAELGARAYTAGDHVVVGEGNGDKGTIAHELAHVVQQRTGPVAGTSHGDFRLSDPADVHERAAESTARRVMSGAAPDREPGPATGDRPAFAHPAGAMPTIQRLIKLGKKHEYGAPEDTKSDEYQKEEKTFQKAVLKRVITEYGARPKSADEVKFKIAGLLYSYWAREQDLIEAPSIPKLTDKLVGEVSNTKRRVTPEERKYAKEIEQIDKRARSTKTRGWKNKEEVKKKRLGGAIGGLTSTLDSAAPKRMKASGRKIFQGSRGFKGKFSAKYWELWDKWSKDTGHPILCHKCNEPITDQQKRDIDHSQAWNDLQARIETFTVCKSGHHWIVALQEKADTESHDGSTDPSDLKIMATDDKVLDESGTVIGVKAYMTRENPDSPRKANLQPMHQSCNTSKSGPKGIDSLAPQPVKDPPHTKDCALPKAE